MATANHGGETVKYAHMSFEGIKKTASTCSTDSGSKIPLRYDFGPGLRSCSICEAPRCFNRGCQVTHRVICQECWPAYVSEMRTFFGLSASFYSSRSTVPDSEEEVEEQLRESLTESEEEDKDRVEAFPLNTAFQFKPSVGSWLLSKPLKVVHTTALTDADDIAMEELSFESSLLGAPLDSVREITREIDGEEERPTPKDQDADREDKKARRMKVTFQPGPIGIRFLDDTITSVEAGSQADRLGVGIGWKIRRLQGFSCLCFGDKRLRASRKGKAPYDVTFEVCMNHDQNTEPSVTIVGHAEAKNSITNSPAKVQLLPDRYDAMMSDLEAKLHEQQQEAASVLASVEKKASRASARLTEIEQRHLRDLSNRAQYVQGNPEMGRRNREGHKAKHVASGDLDVVMSELQLTSELKRRASDALELAATKEQESRERILGLEAAIHAKEEQLAKNMAAAEHMIKEIDRQSNRSKDIKTESEDINIEVVETDMIGETASFHGCVSSDWLSASFCCENNGEVFKRMSASFCCENNGEVFKRMSWFHRWLLSTSI